MKTIGWAVLGVVALSTFQAGCTTGDLTEDQRAGVAEEVESFVASLFGAMNDHDVDAIVSHYDGSAEFIYVGCTSVRAGFQSLERVMRAWSRTNEDVTFDHEILGTRVLDRRTAAVVVQAVTSDQNVLFWTYVVKRDADGWHVAHEHESWSDCPEARGPHPGMDEVTDGGSLPDAVPADAGDSASLGVDGSEAGG